MQAEESLRATSASLRIVSIVGVLLATTAGAVLAGPADEAAHIASLAGFHGGLVVHVGCGDGQLTAALRGGDGRPEAALHREASIVVQGLEADAGKVERAREFIRELGLYGPVSVERFDGKRLPYADNLVNLVVTEDLGGIPREEAIRVLAPGGKLCLRQEGRWTITAKPRPGNIDEWTHFLHDASGNAVGHDEEVGPPGALQWTEGPRHMRSHEHIPGFYALVSTGGRIFYIVDEAPTASIRCLPQWQLVARDAFNGVLLWKKPLATWHPHLVNWGQTPPQLERRLVGAGDRVYVTLGWHAPLSAVDAATGETLKVFENTEGAEEVLWQRGILLLAIRRVTGQRLAEEEKWARLIRRGEAALDDRNTAEPLVKQLRAVEATGELSIAALDADSGRLLWKKTGEAVSGLRPLSLCADEDRVCFQSGKDVVCLDLKTGEERWSKPCGRLYFVQDGNVVCADGESATVLSAATGETRWQQSHGLTQVHDVFLAGGSLWVGGFKPFPEKRGPSWGPYFATQFDLKTGRLLRHIEPENPSHHHRCYLNKATDRYILGGRRGTEFIDLASGDVLWNSWARGVCRYGVMPCNGLLYVPPHACACYMTAKLIGFNALATRRPSVEGAQAAPPLLERGPAYEVASSAQPPRPAADDWPTYRHDAQRSAATASQVAARLRVRWRADLGGRLTPPTVAEGKVFAALVDQQQVCALEADSGRPAWQATAGARVDSPPTIHQGRAMFGCRDGWVYSLRASDGSLVWRERVAREDRRIVAGGQLESVSPVPGSVLVCEGAVYCTAGRSSYLDGGIDLCRLDPGTGKVLSRTPIYSPDPTTGRQPPQFGPAAMPGAREDILVGHGGDVYLRDLVFDRQGEPKAAAAPHLFAMTAFLDDAWAHRSYWIYGTRCSVAGGCSSRDKNLLYGRLLVPGPSAVYGYGRAGVHWSDQLQDGPYRLFAVDPVAGQTLWEKPLPIQVRAMLLAGKVLFAAGPPAGASVGPWDRGEDGPSLVLAVSASDGNVLAQTELAAAPVFDGLAAAGGRLYACLENGCAVCLE